MPHRSPRPPRPAPLLDLMYAPDTAGIERLHALLNWRLLVGSHPFPGPSGGTCFLEAAIVVAGHPYRVVAKSGDVPRDFSLTLSEYLLQLNDILPNEPRQELIRFVPRMAGSFDRLEIEEARIALIVSQTRKHILPLARGHGWRGNQQFKDHPLAWAASVVAFLWETASARAAIERLLAIIEAAFDVGNRGTPVEPLTALVRLESVRPQLPRRAAARVVGG